MRKSFVMAERKCFSSKKKCKREMGFDILSLAMLTLVLVCGALCYWL